jgi:alkylation response protein AidB-like acyl-CoA dehydrogenase
LAYRFAPAAGGIVQRRHGRPTVDCAAVDFELSADQEALRDAARQVLDRHASIERVRRIVGAGEPGAGAEGAVDDYDRELWAVMVDQGWPAVEEPDTTGGLGLGTVELVVLCEEIGRTVAPTPFVGHSLALHALRQAAALAGPRSDGHDDITAWADRLASGESLACLAFAPTADGGGEAAAEGVIERVALTCRPEPTLYASLADVAVVVTDNALFAFGLPEGRPRAQPAMDRTRSLAWLRPEGTPALRIGGPDSARRVLDRAATAVAAELLGAADRVLAMTVAYAGERVQFGHPIGSFQAVKHRLADAVVDVEGMRSCVYYAAWCLAAGHPDASLAASSAKAWCSDAARRVMASGLQVHGGIGFTWEHDLHLFVKRAELDEVTFGDADFHRDRLATLLATRPEGAPALF